MEHVTAKLSTCTAPSQRVDVLVYVDTADLAESVVRAICEDSFGSTLLSFEYAGEVACLHLLYMQQVPFKLLKVEPYKL